MTDRELLKEARDLIVMCSLLDKSGQCEAMADKIDKQLSIANVSESNSPIEIETMASKVFTLANELAIKGYGNAAVKMHSIHNGMITEDHYYSR